MGKKEQTCDCEILHNDKVEQAKKSMMDEETLLNVADLHVKQVFDITLTHIKELYD